MGYSPWGRKESDMTERLFKKELRSHMPHSVVKNQVFLPKNCRPRKEGLLSDQSYKLPGTDWESKLELRNDPFWKNTVGCM